MVRLAGGTLLASGGAGTSWWLRLQAIGSKIRVRVWPEGAAEPSGGAGTLAAGDWNIHVSVGNRDARVSVR